MTDTATKTDSPPPLLQIQDLHKHFAVPVLTGVDFELRRGEVHALMGANGAGKTTLSNIIGGHFPPSAGSLIYHGRRHTPASVSEAETAGIFMVMQELNSIGNLSVAENICFKAMPRRWGFVAYRQLYQTARRALALVGLESVDPRRPMHSLGVGQQQLVEIAAALLRPCELLILDEPTAALTDPQIERLFSRIAELKSRGVGIVYISHRMDEIRRIADRVTVLRDGKSIATRAAAEVSTDDIIALMAGEEAAQSEAFTRRQAGPLALRLSGVGRGRALRDIHLDIHRGEILGIAGLIGSGRTELLRAIFGADPIDAGVIALGPQLKAMKIASPRHAAGQGIGLIPEDRKQQGLLLSQSVQHNISLATLGRLAGKLGWLNRRRESVIATEQRASLAIKCNGVQQPVRELSGGNQQKVVIARWLNKDSDILLFDEPTRGIDIHTKKMIYQLLDRLARQGKAIVVVSSETGELTSLCDRIAVMSNGGLAATYARGEWSREKIMAAAFSGYKQ